MPLSSKSAIEWAVKLAMASSDSQYLFPRYVRKGFYNANSASAALNKYLKPRLSEGCVIHSFRHSMRDRLRAEECPPEIIDAIGGWISAGVGNCFGDEYPLEVKQKWMNKIILFMKQS
jgi:integrase